jgi:hypothetical protein
MTSWAIACHEIHSLQPVINEQYRHFNVDPQNHPKRCNSGRGQSEPTVHERKHDRGRVSAAYDYGEDDAGSRKRIERTALQ